MSKAQHELSSLCVVIRIHLSLTRPPEWRGLVKDFFFADKYVSVSGCSRSGILIQFFLSLPDLQIPQNLSYKFFG